jgi:hypothetical protein
MRRLAQRGILLLPVALTLAVIGTLAYTLTREGSMQVSSVDAEYDMEVARYLTESGVHLAKWQNEKAGCSKEVGFGTVDLPGGRLVAAGMERKGKGELRVSLSATTSRGTVRSLTEQKTLVYDITDVREVTAKTSDGTDTTIVDKEITNLEKTDTLELTDDKSRALLKFSPLPGELDTASVLNAQLTLILYDTAAAQAGRTLSAHRVTRDWGPAITWADVGTSWAPAESAGVPVVDGIPKAYVLDIAGLVDAWTSKTIANQGVLLKSSGLLNARFYSLDTTTVSNRPKLVVRYHPRCA